MTDYVEYDYEPGKLPPEYLNAIGLVTASAAHTESIIEMGIVGCAGIDAERGCAITPHMSAPLRDNVFRSLAEIAIDDLDALDKLDEILDNINQAFTKRNLYVHNSWCRHPVTNDVLLVKTSARGSVNIEKTPASLEQILEDAETIYQAGLSLMSFLMAMDLLSPLPSSFPRRDHKTKAARKKRRRDLRDG